MDNKLYKIKIKIIGDPVGRFIPIKAKSKGEAIVLIDRKLMGSKQNLLIEDIEEISNSEWLRQSLAENYYHNVEELIFMEVENGGGKAKS